jgi:hypothetical protein
MKRLIFISSFALLASSLTGCHESDEDKFAKACMRDYHESETACRLGYLYQKNAR